MMNWGAGACQCAVLALTGDETEVESAVPNKIKTEMKTKKPQRSAKVAKEP
jgi:hypothetical protein